MQTTKDLDVMICIGFPKSPTGCHPGGFPKLGYLFGGPHYKDYSILGSILGSPYLGELPPSFGENKALAVAARGAFLVSRYLILTLLALTGSWG